jgi:hypothetical protein
MQNLDLFRFTARSDRAFSADGWFLLAGSAIDALSGNDVITGESGEKGISIAGTLDAGDGNDAILATGNYDSLLNSGTIRTGAGGDIVDANGITNSGTISTGSGGDRVIGQPFDGFYGIDNLDCIIMDISNDAIIASGIYKGIWSQGLALISTGDRNATIEAEITEDFGAE